jgi:hypothetical protein
MATVLRANFRTHKELDRFLSRTRLPITKVFRKGHKLYPDSQKVTRRAKVTGVNILVSRADIEQPKRQIRESLLFIEKYFDELKRLSRMSADSPDLDFGFNYRGAFCQSDVFPSPLLLALGKLKINLVTSIYPRGPAEA